MVRELLVPLERNRHGLPVWWPVGECCPAFGANHRDGVIGLAWENGAVYMALRVLADRLDAPTDDLTEHIEQRRVDYCPWCGTTFVLWWRGHD